MIENVQVREAKGYSQMQWINPFLSIVIFDLQLFSSHCTFFCLAPL